LHFEDSDSINEAKSSSPHSYQSSKSQSDSEKTIQASKTKLNSTRVLRSATRGQVTHFNEKKKKCHLCRERMEDFKLTRCINYQNCHGAYCSQCLDKHFKAKVKKEKIKKCTSQWTCFVCRGICHCERCIENIHSDLIAIHNSIKNYTADLLKTQSSMREKVTKSLKTEIISQAFYQESSLTSKVQANLFNKPHIILGAQKISSNQ